MTRVLFLIDELDVGGTEQQILELVKRIDRRRYEPLVCCFRPGRVSGEIAAAGVRVIELPKRGKIDPVLVARLVRLMRRERIDLVQTYLFTANTWGRLAALIARVPLIVTSERNVDMWEEPYKQRLGTWLDRWTQRTTGNSGAVADYLVSKGLDRAKVRVIYNGVDTSRFEGPADPHATREEFGIPQHHAVVGHLARLEPQKDPRTFLEAAALVARRNPALSFLVVGGGSLEAEAKRQAEDLGLANRMIFTGPRRDVPRLLAACDLSVLASVKEGMSNTIMESMAAGKPMVATRVGGNPELMADGETGFLVPPRDPAALAGAIQRVLDDPSLAKAMGLSAKARIAERFSVDAMVGATERLYDELVAARRGAPEPAPPDTVALVASQFPRNVDAYFLREVAGLAARGIQFRIFSLRSYDGKVVHQAARPLLARTVYMPFLASGKLWAANARALLGSPGRYLGLLGRLVTGLWRRPRSLVRTLAVFPKSVYFAEVVRREGIRHIHANWASHPAAAALVMSELTGATWSFAGHASDIYLDAGMLRDKIRAARFVTTCTRHNKDHLIRVGGPDMADKITVSYHGVDLDRFQPVASRADGPFRILTVGTLRECKGLPDLIEACRLLGERGVAFQCAIVGDGEERRGLERLIRSVGLADRIRITGFLAQEDLIPLYQHAGAVVLPALSESHFGIPNILLEALAVGTPVICTALPSLSEFMRDGVHGIFVPEQSPPALADAIEALARDPARGRAIGAAGREQIEALFDARINTGVLETLFRAAAAGPRAPLPARDSRSGSTNDHRSREIRTR